MVRCNLHYRQRGIYTAVDNSAKDSTINSPKNLQRNLALTYVLSPEGGAGGDGLSQAMTNDTKSNGEHTVEPLDQMVKTLSLSDDSSKLGASSLTESMLKLTTLESTKISESETIPEQSIDSDYLDRESEIRVGDSLSKSSGIIAENSSEIKLDVPNGNIADYCRTPNTHSRNKPKRKISVFDRSFDIDTLHDETEPGVCSNTYRLTERLMSTPSEQDKSLDEEPFDSESMKISQNSSHFLLSYREKNDESDSSDNLSPSKGHQDHHDYDSLPETVTTNQPSQRPILAPTKFKLPPLMEIPPYASIVKPTKHNDEANEPGTRDSSKKPTEVNETRDFYEKSNFLSNESSTWKNTSSFPNDITRLDSRKIDRGVTYRKANSSRELHFSDFSLLSQQNDATHFGVSQISQEKSVDLSKIVTRPDAQSTCNDSSSKLPAHRANSNLPLSLTYDKQQTDDRTNNARNGNHFSMYLILLNNFSLCFRFFFASEKRLRLSSKKSECRAG